VVPPSLVADLRGAAERAAAATRAAEGGQAQRVFDVHAGGGPDQRLWRDFSELPGLRSAVEDLLGPEHRPSRAMAVLLEPLGHPWMMAWHRDWLDNAQSVDPGQWLEAARNLTMFSQINAPLYDDESLWVVPGSHQRANTAAEADAQRHAVAVAPRLMTMPELVGAMGRMAAGEPVRLQAGDIALYRNSALHGGVYDPRTRRATLHTWFEGPDDRSWHAARQAANQDAHNYS
jgi:hypothetical protein